MLTPGIAHTIQANGLYTCSIWTKVTIDDTYFQLITYCNLKHTLCL